MKSLYTLSDELSSLIRSNIESFKASNDELQTRINTFINSNMKTDSGKKRYPDYFAVALRQVAHVISEKYKNDNLIFCYVIDEELFTTYKNSKQNYFKGKTDIPNYRDAGKEARLIDIRKNGGDVISGFYYPCGKPFYTNEV